MRHVIPAAVVLLICVSCRAPSEPPAPSPEATPAAAPVSASDPEPALPERFEHSMKGYSLYGWKRDGQAWFTLITSTNAAKSFEELDDPEPSLGDDGWVRVRVRGVEAARDLIGRVPAGEESVIVQSIRAPSVAQNTIPDDVGELSPSTLSGLR